VTLITERVCFSSHGSSASGIASLVAMPGCTPLSTEDTDVTQVTDRGCFAIYLCIEKLKSIMSTTLFESEHLTIGYDQQEDYLILKWNGFSEGQEFRDLANEVLRAIAHTKTSRILSDNTHWTTIAPNDQGWAANNWFPKVESIGVRKLATVLSKDFFHRIAERSIEGMSDVDCIHIRNFESTEEASAWLNQKAIHPKC
jgi:hypothetical protein